AFFTIGASEGTGASPTFSGNCAPAPTLKSTPLAARNNTMITRFLMHISCRGVMRILAASAPRTGRVRRPRGTTCGEESEHDVHKLWDCRGHKILCVVPTRTIFAGEKIAVENRQHNLINN